MNKLEIFGTIGAAALYLYAKSKGATPANAPAAGAPATLPPPSAVPVPDGTGGGVVVNNTPDGTGSGTATAPAQAPATPTFTAGPVFENAAGTHWQSQIDASGSYWLAPLSGTITAGLSGVVAPSSAYKGPYDLATLAAAGIWPQGTDALTQAQAAYKSQQIAQQAAQQAAQHAAQQTAQQAAQQAIQPAGTMVNGVFVPAGMYIGGIAPSSPSFSKIDATLTAMLPMSASQSQSNSRTTQVSVSIVAPGFSQSYFASKGAHGFGKTPSGLLDFTIPLNMIVPLAGDSGVQHIAHNW